MDNQITQLIKAFSNELMNLVPEFEELFLAKRDLDNDPTSKKLWTEKEEKRQTIELMKSKGLPVSTEQEQELALKLKEMRENPVAMRYLKAINFAGKISGRIGADLMELVGVDFAARRGCK